MPKSQMTPYDLIIIGGGSAGLTAAQAARPLGVRVALIEGRMHVDRLYTEQNAACRRQDRPTRTPRKRLRHPSRRSSGRF